MSRVLDSGFGSLEWRLASVFDLHSSIVVRGCLTDEVLMRMVPAREQMSGHFEEDPFDIEEIEAILAAGNVCNFWPKF